MLDVNGLCAQRGDFHLHDISFTVHQGECLALMGPTGAGKTLLLESILGVTPLLRGQVLLDQRDVALIPIEERRFSYLPQHLALFPHLSVRENIGFGLRVRGRPDQEIEASVGRMARMLKISHLLDREDPDSLSGGERQRVALARALAIDARMLFLDEPFSALDASIRYELLAEFGALRKLLGIAVVFITHDLNEALLVADTMAVLLNGRLRQIGPPETVYERPRTVSVARLLRVENILPADALRSAGPGHAICRVGSLDVAVAGALPAEATGRGLFLAARARYVGVAARATHDGGGGGWYDGEVVTVSGPPSARRYLLRTASQPPLLVECEHVEDGEPFANGQAIRFRLPPERVFLVTDDPGPAAQEPKRKRSRRNRGPIVPLIILASLLALVGMVGLSAMRTARKTPLRVSVAVILDRSFAAIEKEFERENPGVDVRLDVEPTVTISRMASLRRNDVLALVDHTLIERMFTREEAPWVAVFAASEMVLVYAGHSPHRDQINASNWYRILLRDDVRYAYSNPTLNPCGYFTLFCWRLAEDYYGRAGLCAELVRTCPEELRIHDPPTLLTALQAGTIDYTFVPKPHADDLGLPYLRLPPEINCGDPSFADHYGRAVVEVPDYRGGLERRAGSYVDLGITVLAGSANPTAAGRFVQFVLSERGQTILRAGNLQVITPPRLPKWCRDVPGYLARAVPGSSPTRRGDAG